MKPLLFYFLLLYLPLFAEEKLGGQEIIAELDRTISIKEGLTHAELSIKKGNHQTNFWKVNIFKQDKDVLYTFEATHRKPVAKFLSINQGQKLIYYNAQSGKVFQIEQMEKMENLLHTGFTYLDLSQFQYEALYKAENILISKTESAESNIVKMLPISAPSYKYLQLHVTNVDYSPSKIDFTSQAGLLIKTLKFRYGKFKIREGKSISEVQSLIKLEMTDNNTNITSIIEFKELDKNVNTDKIFYEMKSMIEK